MIDASFWQSTEASFYQQLHILASQTASTRVMPSIVAKNWLKVMRNTALTLFDEWVLDGYAEDMNMKRIVTARELLKDKINKNKQIKELQQIASTPKMEVA